VSPPFDDAVKLISSHARFSAVELSAGHDSSHDQISSQYCISSQAQFLANTNLAKSKTSQAGFVARNKTSNMSFTDRRRIRPDRISRRRDF